MRVTIFDRYIRVHELFPILGCPDGGHIGNEYSRPINLAENGCREIGAAGDTLTILIKFKRVTSFAFAGLDDILVSSKNVDRFANDISNEVAADFPGCIGLP